MTIKCLDCGEEKDKTSFAVSRREKKGIQQPCKPCAAVRAQRYRDADPHKERRRKYKLTNEEIEALLSIDNCEICSRPMTKKCVDHSHVTGKVRGVLCDTCNAGLGLLKDSVEVLDKAKQYLLERN